jgi:hypothetical protein
VIPKGCEGNHQQHLIGGTGRILLMPSDVDQKGREEKGVDGIDVGVIGLYGQP